MITLTDLISECELLAPAPDGLDVPVTGITDDSRDVSRGDLFVAVTGAASDGHRFAEQAVAGGAVAVLAVAEVAFDNRAECRIVDESADQAVEKW